MPWVGRAVYTFCIEFLPPCGFHIYLFLSFVFCFFFVRLVGSLTELSMYSHFPMFEAYMQFAHCDSACSIVWAGPSYSSLVCCGTKNRRIQFLVLVFIYIADYIWFALVCGCAIYIDDPM